MKKIVCLLAMFGLVAVPALATAANSATPQRGDYAEKMFNRMDINGDGVITKKEFEAFNNKRFDELDSNHDGKVTHEEMEAARDRIRKEIGARMQQQFNQRFDAADANHDGTLSKQEAQKMPGIAQRFDEIDTNHDGKVTRDEIRGYMKQGRSARRKAK